MSATASKFEEAYAALNPRQKEAVEAIEGPVMVIAGPGTGKTQILTLRIANILRRTDTPPDAILALTFTDAATANMRRRLVSLIGSRGYYVPISTFHTFSNRIIQEHPEHFPGHVGSQQATAVDQIALIRDILAGDKFEHLTPFGDQFFYAPDLRGAIAHLKKEGFDAAAFAEWVAERKKEFAGIDDLYHEKGAHKGKMKGEYRERLEEIEKQAELARVYAGYERLLRERRFYDYEDMILEVIRAFEKDENFLLAIQEQYQYLLVDEHQDTNGAQNRLLELLMSFYPNPNLFVVGDEKQAIYRFQGASLENFLFFRAKYPEAKVVNLEENYRSTQTILDSASSVIRNNAATLPNALRAERGHPEKPVVVRSFARAEAELLFLAETIKAKIAAGTLPEEIAVLFHDNRDAFPIAEFLERRGVPYIIESDQDILRDPDIRKILLLLETVERFGDDEKLVQALHIDFLGIDPLDAYKLVERKDLRQVSIHRLIASPDRLAPLELEDPGRLHALYLKLKEWRLASKNENFLTLFEDIIRDSGYLAHLLTRPGAFEKTGRLNALFREAKRIVGGRGEYRLADFIRHLDILREHKVAIRGPRMAGWKAVRLMTAHSAKGLEFDSVFVTGLTDGHWGNRRMHERFRNLPFRSAERRNALEKNEDERRLFYMALTRARFDATLTYSLHSPEGKAQVPSQFLGEIEPKFLSLEDGSEWDAKAMADPALEFAPRTVAAPTLANREFLRELFLRRGFTASALNNYLECPWKYFYQNLVRLPHADNRFQVFGNAIHGALQEFFEARAKGEPAETEFLLERFRIWLGKYPLVSAEADAVRRQGEKILPLYHARYKDEWNYRTASEFMVDGVQFSDAVVLKGKMDKLEFGDGDGVTVVDYKTGTPKSRAWIEGKVQDATGNYKRQLVFYRLLLENDSRRKFRMESGVIDFVEPNERGIFKKEKFEITDEEVSSLRSEITRVTDEILGLAFWDRRCEDKKCQYCALRDMLPARTP